MSLMNCTFTVRWSDEKNKPHAKTYATEVDAKRAKKWLLEHGVRSVDIAVKINKSQLAAYRTVKSNLRLWLSRKDFGGRSDRRQSIRHIPVGELG